MLALLTLTVSGCGPVNYRAGHNFDSSLLENALQTGVSSSADVQATLGAPFGKGRALMPYHETPKTVWTYFFEEGSMDLGSGTVDDKRKYLFIFFDKDIYEGYMWFHSRLQ
jgi:hypothetical protein